MFEDVLSFLFCVLLLGVVFAMVGDEVVDDSVPLLAALAPEKPKQLRFVPVPVDWNPALEELLGTVQFEGEDYAIRSLGN